MSRTAEMILSLGRQCSTTALRSGTLPEGELSAMIASGDCRKKVSDGLGVTRFCTSQRAERKAIERQESSRSGRWIRIQADKRLRVEATMKGFVRARVGKTDVASTHAPAAGFTPRDPRSPSLALSRRAREPQMPT